MDTMSTRVHRSKHPSENTRSNRTPSPYTLEVHPKPWVRLWDDFGHFVSASTVPPTFEDTPRGVLRLKPSYPSGGNRTTWNMVVVVGIRAGFLAVVDNSACFAGPLLMALVYFTIHMFMPFSSNFCGSQALTVHGKRVRVANNKIYTPAGVI